VRWASTRKADETGAIRAKVLPLPSFLRKPISRFFIEQTVADTAAYFFTPGMRKRIRDRLVAQIERVGSRPVTIVAHSQGTIIAYEALAALEATAIELDALVTLGSPLGVQEIQDFVDPNHPLRVPAVVKRWHNFADPLDPVALAKKLAGDFEPTGFIEDDTLINNRTRLDWNFNPHSAVGYLAHPKVRKVVNEAMRRDVMSRFVLARDVRSGSAPSRRSGTRCWSRFWSRGMEHSTSIPPPRRRWNNGNSPGSSARTSTTSRR
jgi:pimeloyl-ACP methyl ester carboxylesterase